ncbi:MAG: hypothetical protein QG552_2422 [Thermodesulfobacteriota bacterium]|nr:hypothetical protein [Thermodesulfobacteriota bacterium]
MRQNGENKILIPMDGSNFAFETVRYISNISSLQDRRIVLFTVFNKVPEYFLDFRSNPAFRPRILEIQSWQTQLGTNLETYMHEAREVLLKSGFSDSRVEIRIHEMKKGIARDIIREAKEGYEVVVAGKRGMGRIAGIVLGSVAMKLLQGISFAPLILVGKDPRPGRILLTFDGSEGSMKAVMAVASLLGRSDWEVNLTHAVRLGPEEKEAIHEAELEIGAAFDQAVDILIKSGIPQGRITTQIITGVPSRSEAIVKEAGQRGCGTIAVGRRGHSKVSDFFMGRVSHKIVQMSKGHAVMVVS